MAELKLKVTVDAEGANDKIGKLKEVIDALLSSLQNVTVNKDLTAQMNAFAKAVNGVAKASKAALDQEKLRTQQEKTATEQSKQMLNAEKAKTEASKQQTEESKRQTEELKRHTQSQKEYTKTTKEARETAEDYRHSIVDLARSFLEYQIAASLIMKPIYKIREAFQSVDDTLVETENAVIELKRVLSEQLNGQDMANALYDIAIGYGQKIENVFEIAQNFAKSGLSWADTLKATEAAVLALNVAELDATEASNGLIAVMAQFGYTAEDLTYIVDALNKTADKAPVSTEKLLQALQKTGSYAKAANMSLEQTAAIVTGISAATGASGQQLGTAMKSLLAYTTKGKALDLYSSLSPNMDKIVSEYKKGAVSIYEVWKQLSVELKNISAEQKELIANYMTTEDGKTLNEELAASIGEEMEDLQDGLTGVYDTAGTYRKNYFIALMNNFDAVEKAMNNLSDVEGYSQKENLQYMESYTAKVQSLEAQWKKLANDEQGWLQFKKDLVEVGSLFLKLIEWTGGLRTAVLALGTVVAAVFGQNIVSQMQKSIESVKTSLLFWKQHKTAVEADTVATEENTAAKKANSAAIAGMLTWIGIAITAISTLQGVIDNARQSAEDARKKIVEEWDADRDRISNINALLKKYEETSSATSEYLNIEEKLVKVLKDKNLTLSELTKGTDAYREAVIRLSQEELNDARISAYRSGNAAIANAGTGETDDSSWLPWNDEVFRQTMHNLFGPGISLDYDGGKFASNVFYRISVYEKILKLLEDAGETNSAYYADVYENLKRAQTKAEGIINGFGDYYGIQAAQGELSYDNAVTKALEDSGLAGFSEDWSWVRRVKNAVKSWAEYQSGDGSSGSTVNVNGRSVADADRKEIIALLKGIREATDTLRDIEEKRQAALDAERNLTTRVYDAATGRFVPTANTKEAQKAKDALNSALEKAAYNEILDAMNSDNGFTYAQLQGIIDKYAAMGIDASPAWASTLAQQISGAMGFHNDDFGVGSTIFGAAIRGSQGAGSTTTNNSYTINGITYAPGSLIADLITRLFNAAAAVK